MADVVSAGTLVGAILETAGYVTQQRILQDFHGFFQHLGAHLYAIAGIGGLMSIVVFGSYRMARYLVLGPWLFWIMLGPTQKIDGVWWVLGKQKAVSVRPVVDQLTEQEAAKLAKEYGREGPIEVSRVFYHYTRIVSDVVNAITQRVLQYHDKGDYLFFNRRFAIDSLVNAYPQRSPVISMLHDTFIGGPCKPMMDAALSRSTKYVSTQFRQQLQAQRDQVCQVVRINGKKPDPKWLKSKTDEIFSKWVEQRQYEMEKVNQTFVLSERERKALREQAEEKAQAEYYNEFGARSQECQTLNIQLRRIDEARANIENDYNAAKQLPVLISPQVASFIYGYWNESERSTLRVKNFFVSSIPTLQAIAKKEAVDFNAGISEVQLDGAPHPEAMKFSGKPISCGAMYDVMLNAIMADATLLVAQINKALLGKDAPKGAAPEKEVNETGESQEEVLCRELAKKLGFMPGVVPESRQENAKPSDFVDIAKPIRAKVVTRRHIYTQNVLLPTHGEGAEKRDYLFDVEELQVVSINPDGTMTVLVPDPTTPDKYNEVTGMWEVREWLDDGGAPVAVNGDRYAYVWAKYLDDGRILYARPGNGGEDYYTWYGPGGGQFKKVRVLIKERTSDGKYVIEAPQKAGSGAPVASSVPLALSFIEWEQPKFVPPPIQDFRNGYKGDGNRGLYQCDLVQMASLYILRNMLIYTPHGQFATEIKMRSFFNAPENVLRTQTMDDSDSTKDTSQIISWENAYFKAEVEEGQLTHKIAVHKRDENGNLTYRDGKPVIEWKRFMHVESDGHVQAGYTIHQRYQTDYLQQGIFTWALQLPYYQGCLLYLLAVAYPFMCLLLVMPGKAPAFINLPLAWLWIKSWDIGFAVTMVLEKVLWNLLPQSKFGYQPLMQMHVQYDNKGNASIVEGTPLLDMFEAAFSVDPSYHIHAHFNYLTIVLFAIPPITGYLIMKGKHSVLASFVDGPKTAADDAGQIAQGRYGVGMMNEKVFAMKRAEGQVLNFYRGDNMTQGGRGARAVGWAAASVAPELIGDGAESLFGTQDKERGRDGKSRPTESRSEGALRALNTAVQGGIKNYQKMLNSQTSSAAYYDMAWGSFKEHRKRQGAIFAAMDAFGEHEMTHFLEARNALTQEVSLFETQVGMAQGVISGALSQAAKWNKRDYDKGLLSGNSAFQGVWDILGGGITAAGHAYTAEMAGKDKNVAFKYTTTGDGNYRLTTGENGAVDYERHLFRYAGKVAENHPADADKALRPIANSGEGGKK